MVNKPEKLGSEQVLQSIIEEETKKEKTTEEPVKTEESWFNYKKVLILIFIGLFSLIMFYYILEYIKS